MLIIDSIMGLLKHDFTGRGELSERQQILGQMLSKLKKLAYEFNLAIVITNQVISDPSGGAVFVSDPKKPIGGHGERSRGSLASRGMPRAAEAPLWQLSLPPGGRSCRLRRAIQLQCWPTP